MPIIINLARQVFRVQINNVDSNVLIIISKIMKNIISFFKVLLFLTLPSNNYFQFKYNDNMDTKPNLITL